MKHALNQTTVQSLADLLPDVVHAFASTSTHGKAYHSYVSPSRSIPMSSFNGLAYNDLISIRDLLLRAKTKTRQRTYRNHHIQASTIISQTSGQPPEQLGSNDGSLTSPIVPITASGLTNQHDHETIADPSVEEEVSRPRSRSPRVNKTYSKKTTSNTQYLMVEEPQQICAREKLSQRIHTSSKQSAEQESGDNDVHRVGQERARRKVGKPRRGTYLPRFHHILILPTSSPALCLMHI